MMVTSRILPSEVWRGWLCALALVLAVTSVAPANFVEIDFRDQNLPTSAFPNAGGPHWRGVVDTVADTLTITSWEELPGSTPYWTPSLANGPLIWSALDATGNRFDVPDSFGSNGAHIGSNWGFISPLPTRDMVWNEGTVMLPAVADYYPGWGAALRPVAGQNPPQMFYDTAANEQTMPLVPYGPFSMRPALQATVTVGPVILAASAPVSAIPEPSAWAFGALVAGIVGGTRVVRRWFVR